MRQTSLPCQLGIQASPSISVTTNGPLPTGSVSRTVFVAGSTMATEFPFTLGTHTSPPITAGSPAPAPTFTVATAAFVAGSIRVNIPSEGCVIQIASADAAVQVAAITLIRA